MGLENTKMGLTHHTNISLHQGYPANWCYFWGNDHKTPILGCTRGTWATVINFVKITIFYQFLGWNLCNWASGEKWPYTGIIWSFFKKQDPAGQLEHFPLILILDCFPLNAYADDGRSHSFQRRLKQHLLKMAPNQGGSLTSEWGDNVTSAEKVRPEPDGVPEGLIRVENKLYSTEELAKLHPGGPVHIKVCTCSVVSTKNAPIILMM